MRRNASPGHCTTSCLDSSDNDMYRSVQCQFSVQLAAPLVYAVVHAGQVLLYTTSPIAERRFAVACTGRRCVTTHDKQFNTGA